MTTKVLKALALLIEREQDALLATWRTQVRELPSARNLDTPTLNDHIPDLLRELIAALRSGSDETIAEAVVDGSPPEHGLQRVRDAFDIEEVVAEYNILRGCIHDLADENGVQLQGEPFHVLNRVFDGSIGAAVQTFGTHKAREVLNRREEYLAFVAHDLRTPLNAISLASRVLESLLTETIEQQPKALQMFSALHRSVDTLQALVAKVISENSTLLVDSGLKLERRRFYLWPLVESLIHDLHPVAGTGSTELTNEVPFDLQVFADASLLRRILQNLIANAISYTPHGEIIIGACLTPHTEDVECFVRDDGAGMSEERQAMVFAKHETDSGKPGGLGLGLAIVQTFVEAHAGTVTVESKPGQGTTFRFTLPGKTERGSEAG